MKTKASIGCDLVEVKRFKGKKATDSFIRRWFSPKEISYCFNQPNPHESLAGRFAAKEAFIKAGNPKADCSRIEVLKSKNGGLELFSNGKKTKATVSISHVKEYAIAVVLNQ